MLNTCISPWKVIADGILGYWPPLVVDLLKCNESSSKCNWLTVSWITFHQLWMSLLDCFLLLYKWLYLLQKNIPLVSQCLGHHLYKQEKEPDQEKSLVVHLMLRGKFVMIYCYNYFFFAVFKEVVSPCVVYTIALQFVKESVMSHVVKYHHYSISL